MTIVYVETSALVKRYVQEVGSDVIDELFEHQLRIGIFTMSILGALELKSALARLQRGGRITEPEMFRLLAQFRSDRNLFSVVLPVDNSLMDEAGDSLSDHALRTLDAIHFASTLRLKTLAGSINEEIVVVTSDRELVSAWDEEGFASINPEDDEALEYVQGLLTG